MRRLVIALFASHVHLPARRICCAACSMYSVLPTWILARSLWRLPVKGGCVSISLSQYAFLHFHFIFRWLGRFPVVTPSLPLLDARTPLRLP